MTTSSRVYFFKNQYAISKRGIIGMCVFALCVSILSVSSFLCLMEVTSLIPSPPPLLSPHLKGESIFIARGKTRGGWQG